MAPLDISGSLDKTDDCSDHYIKVSTQSSDSGAPWGSRSGFVTFVWNCDSRYIYGQANSVSTSCSSHQSYDIEITVDESTVTFRDTAGACGDLSLTDSIGASGPLYAYVGADADYSAGDAVWNSVEICAEPESQAPTPAPTTPAPTPQPTVPAPTPRPTEPVPTADLCTSHAEYPFSNACFRWDGFDDNELKIMGPQNGNWNTESECDEQGEKARWTTHWCPALELSCDLYGAPGKCLVHDQRDGSLRPKEGGGWKNEAKCEKKGRKARYETVWCPDDRRRLRGSV